MTTTRLEVRRPARPPFPLLVELAHDDAAMFGHTGLRDIDIGLVSRTGAVYEALLDGVRIGSCQILRMWDDPAAAWVVGFYILPEHQGYGWGRAFLEAIATEAGAAGLRRLLLTVDPRNTRAVRLYQGFGFVRVDVALDFYGPGEDRDVFQYEIAEETR